MTTQVICVMRRFGNVLPSSEDVEVRAIEPRRWSELQKDVAGKEVAEKRMVTMRNRELQQVVGAGVQMPLLLIVLAADGGSSMMLACWAGALKNDEPICPEVHKEVVR